MTYAPQRIREVRAYLKGQDPDLEDVELGITGGPGHVATGTSYHLGLDQLKLWKNPYSYRTYRDKAGATNAASALDVDDDLDELRELSVWVVDQCRAGAPDTLDLREVIYSPDGIQVLQWDRERGTTSLPQPHPDLSHRTHSHFSWYRDSENRDKVGLFRRFYAERETKAVTSMFCEYGDGKANPAIPAETLAQTRAVVKAFQLALIRAGGDLTPYGGPDGVYGDGTATVAVAVLGEVAGDGRVYGPDQYDALMWLAYAAPPGEEGPPGKTPTMVRLVGPVDLPVIAAE